MFGRLEKTLKYAGKYWGRTPRGQIECYVVDDLKNWTDAELPHRLARIIVGGVGGATIPRSVGTGKRTRNMPTVFASSLPGVAEHELVHAYCTQTFGSTGPNWYKEGMAEMVVRKCTRKTGIVCTAAQIESLRGGRRSTVREVLSSGSTGKQLLSSLNKMLSDPKHQDQHVPLSEWTARDSANVDAARAEYLRCWALCYVLLHNPNYAKRFRTLGNEFLIKRDTTFVDLFGPVQNELAFEYAFLLKHIDVGYRVDLCRWDWHTRFRALKPGSSSKTRLVAARGYQGSGLEVAAGQRYFYEAAGEWATESKQPGNADGGANGVGRLVGVVMNDYKIGESFPLGASGEFKAPASGKLYLRCQDAWNGLSDNQGEMVVRFTCR